MRTRKHSSRNGYDWKNWAVVVGASLAMVLMSGCTNATPTTDTAIMQHASPVYSKCSNFTAASLAAGDSLGQAVFGREDAGLVGDDAVATTGPAE